mmetsp:Transcript_40399/g.97521  ORF Transcript_40399/g.97521 Transcript_40399/m.97521 type:complete len:302 (+) Transcript_40399:91-996(+)
MFYRILLHLHMFEYPLVDCGCPECGLFSGRGAGLLGLVRQLYHTYIVRRMYTLRQHDNLGRDFKTRRAVLLRPAIHPSFVFRSCLFGFVSGWREVEAIITPTLPPLEQCEVVESVDSVSRNAPYYGEGGRAPFSIGYVLLALMPFIVPALAMAVYYHRKKANENDEDYVPRVISEARKGRMERFDREPQQSDDLLPKRIDRDVEQPSGAVDELTRAKCDWEEEEERELEMAIKKSMGMTENMMAKFAQMQESQYHEGGATGNNNGTDAAVWRATAPSMEVRENTQPLATNNNGGGYTYNPP